MQRQYHPSRAVDPPFSPVLLAGLALTPLPPRFLQPLADIALAGLVRRHPDILDRLSDYPDAMIGIDPVDLPFVFVLELRAGHPRLTLHRSLSLVAPGAVIRGSLAMLVGLAEGRLDGDAAFFSRQLAFEGDTEVVLALRNAVDAAGLDLVADLAGVLGPLAKPLQVAGRLGGRLFDRLARDMDTVRTALLAPVLRGAEGQAVRLDKLEADVGSLSRAVKQQEPAR
jgi:predicted lipid carrier protein YhbT